MGQSTSGDSTFEVGLWKGQIDWTPTGYNATPSVRSVLHATGLKTIRCLGSIPNKVNSTRRQLAVKLAIWNHVLRVTSPRYRLLQACLRSCKYASIASRP